MALTEKAKKRWIDKFNRLREERDSRYADQAHRRFCEAEGNASYDRVPVFETGVSQLEFPRLGWLLYHRSFMILAYPPKWESETLEIKTFRHDLLDPVFQTMPGYVRGDIPDLIDMKWYGDCLEYLRGLSPLQLILLHDYARDGYKYTNSQGWNVVETDRIIEVQDEEAAIPIHFYEVKSRVWPGVVWLARHGVDGVPFQELDQGKICRKRADIAELRAALVTHLSRRSGDPNVALVVDNRLKGELVNMAGWKEVIAMIAKLDERLMDIIFLLSKWACKYLHLTFIREHVLKEYAREMFAILQEAPVINREMIVYRGVTEDYYMPARGRRDVYKNTFPISVSVDPAVAINFLFNRYMSAGWGRSTEDCCLKVIHIMPGTPALAMWPIAGGEQAEILLPPGTDYLIKSHRLRHIIAGVPTFTKGRALKSEVCWDAMITRKSGGTSCSRETNSKKVAGMLPHPMGELVRLEGFQRNVIYEHLFQQLGPADSLLFMMTSKTIWEDSWPAYKNAFYSASSRTDLDTLLVHPRYMALLHDTKAPLMNNRTICRICVFDKDHEIAGDGSWRGPAGEPCAGRVDVESSNIPLIVDGPGVMTAFLDYREVKGFLLRRPFFDIVVLDPAIFLKNGEFKAFDYAVLATVIHLDRWKVEYKCTLFAVMRRQGYLGHYPGSRATRTNRCMELVRQWIFASRGRVEIRGARNVVLGSGDKGSLEDQIHGLENGHGRIRFFFPESTSLFTTSDMISELLEDRLAEGTRCKLVLYKTANQPRPFMEKCEKIFISIVLVGFTDVDLHHPSTKVALIPVGERPSKVTVYLGGEAGSVFTIYYCGYEVLRNTLSRRGKEAFNMVPINKATAGDWGAHFPLILKYWFV
eukprot:jgi/Mesvir1/1386/Mv22569-RA.1